MLYTAITTVFKLALGLWLAMLLNRHFRGKAMVRAFILLPFIIPTVLSTFAWKWMFDPTFSVLNWLLFKLGLITGAHQLAGRSRSRDDLDHHREHLARRAVLRHQPARRAADHQPGAATRRPRSTAPSRWQRFWYITWPLLLPVTMVVVLFSVIQTFADFQLVYVLTGGGPANATHLFATYAYQIGIRTGLLSEGAAISLAIFPILFLVVLFQLLYIRRVETR